MDEAQKIQLFSFYGQMTIPLSCGQNGILIQKPEGWHCGQCFCIIWPVKGGL